MFGQEKKAGKDFLQRFESVKDALQPIFDWHTTPVTIRLEYLIELIEKESEYNNPQSSLTKDKWKMVEHHEWRLAQQLNALIEEINEMHHSRENLSPEKLSIVNVLVKLANRQINYGRRHLELAIVPYSTEVPKGEL